MSLDSFIQYISAGKIRLKYRMVERRFSRRKHILFQLLMLLCFGLTLAWFAYAMSQKLGLIACLLPFLFLTISSYFINKWAGKFKQVGMIYFDSESCTISTQTEHTIPYSSINAINFRIHVEGIHASKNRASPHSYTIQIITDTNSYLINVECKLFLIEEDHLQFNRGYPEIIGTLTQLQKAYKFPAVERERKFKLEGSAVALKD